MDYWARLQKLGIMSLQRRREKLTILFVWKLKNNAVVNDINMQFCKNQRNSKVKAVLKPMPHVSGRLLSSFEDSFIIRSAKLWNHLPSELTEISSYNVFKSKLEKYLTFYPDKPPVHGYYHQTKNSIRDYRSISYESVFKTV